jgi:catechol 2,3-dioxygenase-like lactoylglutathione lyase family enzyme
MNKVTVFKLYVSDQEGAKRFYVDQLGFEVAEDRKLGDYLGCSFGPPTTGRSPSILRSPRRINKRPWSVAKGQGNRFSRSAPTIVSGTTPSSNGAV